VHLPQLVIVAQKPLYPAFCLFQWVIGAYVSSCHKTQSTISRKPAHCFTCFTASRQLTVTCKHYERITGILLRGKKAIESTSSVYQPGIRF